MREVVNDGMFENRASGEGYEETEFQVSINMGDNLRTQCHTPHNQKQLVATTGTLSALETQQGLR
jgi:hypothetical protein